MTESEPNGSESKSPETGRIESLQAQITELKKQWPAHSVPPAMMQRLDELEEALEQEIALSLTKKEKSRPGQ